MNTQSYEELCFENDEINRKWAEDNERNGDIMAEQQEQIKRLEEEIELKKILTERSIRNLLTIN